MCAGVPSSASWTMPNIEACTTIMAAATSDSASGTIALGRLHNELFI